MAAPQKSVGTRNVSRGGSSSLHADIDADRPSGTKSLRKTASRKVTYKALPAGLRITRVVIAREMITRMQRYIKALRLAKLASEDEGKIRTRMLLFSGRSRSRTTLMQSRIKHLYKPGSKQ